MKAKRVGQALGRRVKRAGGTRRRVDTKDLLALQFLAPIVTDYLPWSGSAIAPQTAVQLCNELALNGRRTVVELGSGISTLVMAMWAEAEQESLHIMSIDEDDVWIQLMRTKLEKFRYADVTFVHAPLRPYRSDPASLKVSRWYDTGLVDTAVTGPVDMLVVDGPTAYREEWQYDRWPALPELVDRLSPKCAVMLDDTSRPGESAILQSWSSLFPGLGPRVSGPATWLVRGDAWQV